jgi:hypothetical protein
VSHAKKFEPQGEPFSDDLLYGAAAIAQFMFGNKQKRRQVYGLAAGGQIPVFRLNAILCARKSSIRNSIAERERAATAA